MDVTQAPIIPGISSGILQPKHANRFRVLFVPPNGDVTLPALLPISMQVVSFNSPRIDLTRRDLEDQLSFVIEDDIINGAITAILGAKGTQFDILLEVLDGNEGIIERVRYKRCTFVGVQYTNGYNYAYSPGNSSRVKAVFLPPQLIGNAIEEAPGADKLLKLLELFFKNLTIRVDLPPDRNEPRGVIERTVTVAFSGQETTFGQELK